MPIPDPRAGYATVWFITCFLFISIAIGGGFLVMYMILPESDSTYWLPVAGVTLVCLPWLFWFCTCMYRIVSRFCGFRIGCCVGGGSGDEGGRVVGGHGCVVHSIRGRSLNSNQASVNNYNSPNNNNDESQGRNNNLGQNGDIVSERNKSGDSTASREIEIPLTSSMAP